MPFDIPSIRTLTTFAGSLLSQLPLGHFDTPATTPAKPVIPFGNGPSCPADGPPSCRNTTEIEDSCCFIYPGGQLLSTQFWDTSPSVGPSDSWTLHGLWPDLCDGNYPTFCTFAPQYPSITDIVSTDSDLVDFMNTYWLPNRGGPESFWQHEWNKHGTCINTLAPSCYGDDYQSGDELLAFFRRAVEIFKGLDSYKALASVNILPSYTQTYTRVEIEDALKSINGGEVVLGCHGNRLDEAWYSFNVQGSLQSGAFLPVDPAGKSRKSGTCPKRGIRYLPKN